MPEDAGTWSSGQGRDKWQVLFWLVWAGAQAVTQWPWLSTVAPGQPCDAHVPFAADLLLGLIKVGMMGGKMLIQHL